MFFLKTVIVSGAVCKLANCQTYIGNSNKPLLKILIWSLVMTYKYPTDIRDAQKAIFWEIRPTVEHFWTDVCDSTRSVKGQNVNR